ncbi:U-scoloptoxin(01)-Er1a-like 2 [Homarus americanus]|uniref:U-scoloptoxin(01)-Er1a-like 2 n=1 Tax=Homarus americanus TaxID=6706 RepID=A0A8J5JUH4_HOMAM|nr:U-scoloptoxin(01)-Er1a-like 2 [Homarus americanus]
MTRIFKEFIFVVAGCWVSVLPLSCAQARKLVPPQTPPQGEKLDAQHSILPLVRFECVGRAGGYYGDMDFGCTVFHYCAKSGQRFTFKCTPGLTFNETW